MRIYFKEETLKALCKAGCKSKVFRDEDVYRGKDVDTRAIQPEDFDLIKKVVKENKGLWEHIENRRVYRKLNALESFKKTGLKKTKIKKLELLADAIQEAVGETPHKWVFRMDSEYGVLLPHFVTDVSYHPPVSERGYHKPAYVDMSLRCVVRGEEKSTSVNFHREDLKGTLSDILLAAEAYIENETLVSEYEDDMKRYRDYSPKTGEQFLARGSGQIVGESRWRREEAQFERDNEPAKVVMDDVLEQGKSSGYHNTKFWSDYVDEDEEEETEDGEVAFAMPTHPIVRVFNLWSHEFIDCHVGCVEPYKYDSSMGEKLVLPDEHRELIDALTGSALQKMDDIIRGKARGVIILCSGKPGTGKTLTAEVYSEVAKRPLYMVQCSQLGTDEEELEKRLSTVLDRSTRWGAILLIDEADVYIHERGNDIQQNAIVGVFLRLLEYYNGILFMNTNRETIIDDAILSRATAHVRYDVLQKEVYRRSLWEVLARQYAVKNFPIEEAMKEFPDISGRDIRQLIRLALVIANKRKTKLTLESLKLASQYHDFTRSEKGK